MLLDMYKQHTDRAAMSGEGFLPTAPRGFGSETLEAGFEAATAPDEFARTAEYRRKLYDEAVTTYEKETGGKLVSPSVYDMDRDRAIKDFGVSGPGLQAAIDQHRAEVDEALTLGHEQFADVPDPRDFDKAITEESTRRRQREALLGSTASFGGNAALFLGSMAGEMTHPFQVMTLPFGGIGGGAAKTAIGRLALSAAEQSAIAAGTQTAIEVGDHFSRKRFGTEVGFDQAALNIASAAIGGAVFDSVAKAVPAMVGAGSRVVATGGRNILDRYARAPRAALDAVNVAESDAFTIGANTVRPADVTRHVEALNAGVSAVDQMRAAPAIKQVEAPARLQAEARPTSLSSPDLGNRVFTAAGRPIDVEYQVTDAGSLITSHHGDLTENPAFPSELQPRDRTRAASQAQISEIAARLEPQRLAGGADAATGAPVVGPDNIVESGNGRVMALRETFRRQPERAAAYRQHLQDLGFDVSGMAEPALIRRRVTGMTWEERAAFTREANEAPTMSMGTSEQALADAQRVPAGVLDLYQGGDLTLARNRGFTRNLIDALPPSERAAMMMSDGTLSQAGVKRLEAGLLAKAYNDPGLVAKLTEATDVDIRAIGKALTEAAPGWAQMRARAAAGEIAPGMDVTADLLTAIRTVERSRAGGTSVGDLLAQGEMFGQGLTEPAFGFLRMMFRDGEMRRPASQAALTERLGQFVEEANKTRPGPDMFGSPPATPGEVLGVSPGGGARDVSGETAQPTATSETMTASAMDTEVSRLLERGDFEVPMEVIELDGVRQLKMRSARELLAEADSGVRAADHVMRCAVGAVGGR